MKHTIETHEPRQIEVRGTVHRPQKSRFYSAILQWTDPDTGEPGRLSKTTKQTDRTAALRVMLEMVEQLESDLHKAAPSALVVDFLVYWFREIIVHEVEETTYYGYRLNLENHILPYFRKLRLRLMDLEPRHITEFMDYMMSEEHAEERGSKPLKGKSVRRYHANLKTAFDLAVKNGWMKFNPARMVVPPAEEKYIAEFYYMDEIVELWMAAKGTIIEPAVFLTSLYGFRRGEICGLKTDKLNFRQRVIPIIEQRTTAGREVTKKTKTNASTRMMPMMEAVAQYINIIVEQQEERKAFLGSGYTDSGYLITNEFGKPLSLSRLDKAFSRLLEKKGMRHIRFHDLRHPYVKHTTKKI